MTSELQARLHEIFDYDEFTGLFIRKISLNSRAQRGTEAGAVNKISGYKLVMVDHVRYYVHRLVWIYLYGSIPDDMEIDHKDGCKTNNVKINLRLVTHSQNCKNTRIRKDNNCGEKGVRYDKRRGHWWAQITNNGKRHYLGTFSTQEEAVIVVRNARASLHGEYCNYGI